MLFAFGWSVIARPYAAGEGEAIWVEGFAFPDCHVAALLAMTTMSLQQPKPNSTF